MYQGGRGGKGRELSLEVVRLKPEREEALKVHVRDMNFSAQKTVANLMKMQI